MTALRPPDKDHGAPAADHDHSEYAQTKSRRTPPGAGTLPEPGFGAYPPWVPGPGSSSVTGHGDGWATPYLNHGVAHPNGRLCHTGIACRT